MIFAYLFHQIRAIKTTNPKQGISKKKHKIVERWHSSTENSTVKVRF